MELTPRQQIQLWLEHWDNNPRSEVIVLRNIRQIATDGLTFRRSLNKLPKPDLDRELSSFLQTRSRTQDKLNILTGAFYVNDGRFYFSISDWIKWTVNNGRPKLTYTSYTKAIRLRGGNKSFFRLKEEGMKSEGRNMWWVPASTVPDPPSTR